MKTYTIKLDGKQYKVTAEHGDDGYTYLVDVATGQDIHSMETRDWRG